jgi:signal transduction histidine kinase
MQQFEQPLEERPSAASGPPLFARWAIAPKTGWISLISGVIWLLAMGQHFWMRRFSVGALPPEIVARHDLHAVILSLLWLGGMIVLDTVLARQGRRRREAENLLRIQRDLAVVLGSATNVRETLDKVFDVVFQIDGIDAGGVYLTDPDRGEPVLAAYRGISKEFADSVRHFPPDIERRAVMAAGRPLYGGPHSPDVKQMAMVRAEKLTASVLLPIVHENRVIGAMALASRRYHEFPAGTRHVVDSIATWIGGMAARLQAREAQARAVRAERLAAIGQMAAGLAHESRNALQRSQACLEMLVLEIQDRPAALDLVQRLQRAQDDLQQRYEEVREYAAPVLLERASSHLPGLLDQAWADLESARRGRAAGLRGDGEDCVAQCAVDRDAIRRVFRNALANALETGADPLEIAVAWRDVDLEGRPAVQVSLCDNGPGMDREQQSNIFEPFYTTKTRGTGLGMAISKRIIEAHGGHISVGPHTAPGRGAEIVIVIPKEQA